MLYNLAVIFRGERGEQRIWIVKVGKQNLNLPSKLADNSFYSISKREYGKYTGLWGRYKEGEIATGSHKSSRSKHRAGEKLPLGKRSACLT